MTQWLSLLDYSSKHGISLSTLRRRIKDDAINFKMENGKYFIADEAPTQIAPRENHTAATPFVPTTSSVVSTPVSSPFVEASVLSSANRLVEELKAAYAKILQEKEEQISLLKEEVVDLRMLVRILEQQSSERAASQKTESSKTNDNFMFGEISLKDI